MAGFLKVDLVNSGTGILQALGERYEGGTTALARSGATATPPAGGVGDGSPADSARSGNREISVHLAGEDKVKAAQRLARLTSVSVQGSTVSHVEGDGALGAACPRLREVDASGTLLCRWADVARLGAQLPGLHTLHLGSNRMEYLGDVTVEALPAGALAQLRVLVLNGTPLTWDQVMRLARLAPGVEELHLVGCGLARTVEQPASWDAARLRVMQARCGDSFVPGGPHLFPALRVINLSGNPLGTWGALHALGTLPSLSTLLASECGITSVFADVGSIVADGLLTAGTPGARIGRQLFPALDTLSLTGNALGSAANIDALDSALPALTTLRLSHTDLAFSAGSEIDAAAIAAAVGAPPPVSAQPPSSLGPSEARQLLVARLPRLTSLNGSDVRPKERADAEKAYARRLGAAFAAAWTSASAAAASSGGSVGSPTAAAPRVTDLFGCKSVTLSPDAYASSSSRDGDRRDSTASDASGFSAVQSTASTSAHLPAAFKRAGDGGVIRSHKEVAPVPYAHSLVPAFAVSAPLEQARPAPYVPVLDPTGLGAARPDAAGSLQRAFPRYFIVAAAHDMHAQPAASTDAGSGSLASSVVNLQIRSLAGRSCMMEPQVKRIPLSMTIGALKQLAARLFKAPDVTAVQLSYQEAGVSTAIKSRLHADACLDGYHHPLRFLDNITLAVSLTSQSSYPMPLDDDLKPLSYYGVTPANSEAQFTSADGSSAGSGALAWVGEILLEEVDKADAARKAAAAARAEEGEARAQDALVIASQEILVGGVSMWLTSPRHHLARSPFAERIATQAALGDALLKAADKDRRGPTSVSQR